MAIKDGRMLDAVCAQSVCVIVNPTSMIFTNGGYNFGRFKFRDGSEEAFELNGL